MLTIIHVIFAFCLITFPVAEAEAQLLSVKEIRALLGPYPVVGTEASTNDYNELMYWQNTRTDEQCKVAMAEESATFDSMFGKLLTPTELKKVKMLISLSSVEVNLNTALAKTIYRRPRPYKTWNDLVPCVKRPGSDAYPSGHTSSARVYARILAEAFPERYDLFMKRGNEVAFNRVLGGVHHPSDIVAGKKLGDTLSKKIISTPQFKNLRNLLFASRAFH